jgi:DEAD/DEAH box helicase domain-containing protein
MVDFEDFLKFIKSQDFYCGQIYHIEHIPELKARFEALDKPLRKRLERWLTTKEIKLWSHQAEAINSIRQGNNTVIVTSTASGKSLCYNLPVVDYLLNNEKTTALYLFPTKALARDQYSQLKEILSETNIKEYRIGVYDGDITPDEKRRVLASANIIII